MKRLTSILIATLLMAMGITSTGLTPGTAFAQELAEFSYNLEGFEGINIGDELPFGKGTNSNCYFPKATSSEFNLPEIYTWNSAKLVLSAEGTVATAAGANRGFLIEFDKAPTNATASINNKVMNALIVTLKSAHKLDDATISIVSQGNTYKKSIKCNLTGEFQEIVFDLYSQIGWFMKNSEGKYDPYVSDRSPWESGDFSKAGIRIDFPACGKDVVSSFTIKSVTYAERNLEGIAENAIENGLATHNAYIKGYPDGTFRPSGNITRAEAATIVARELGFETAEYEKKVSFTDVDANAWYFNAVAFLEANECLNAFNTSSIFDAQKQITRAEFVSLLPTPELLTDPVEFTDLSKQHRLYDSVVKAAGIGIINGYPDGTFRSDNTITRAEAVKVVNSFFGRKADMETFKSYDISLFNDVPTTHWAFAEICEAAVNHFALITDSAEEWKKIMVLEEPDHQKTAQKIAEIDAAAEKMKQRILNTPTEDLVAFGDEYYVSNDGNDSADGKTPETAWKTLAKVSSAPLNAGDIVYFRRGDLFRGHLVGKTGVTYTAYGEGAKPRLYRSPENGAGEEKWSLVEGTTNIWKFYKEINDAGLIVFNDGEEHAFKLTPCYIDGNFVDEKDRVTIVNPVTYLKNDLDFYCAADSVMTNGRPQIGNVDCVGEVYLRCDRGNPGKIFTDIEFNNAGHVIRNSGNNITYDNLCVKYGGFHGIGSGTTEGLVVTNCEFGWIGGGSGSYSADGSYGRYGNAIEIYGGCDYFLVDNCYIYQAYDCGPTHQYASGGTTNITMKDVIYTNNLIEYCTYSIEYFLGKPSVPDEECPRMQYNILMENNICRYAGFGFGEQRRDKGTAAHIKGWDHYNPDSGNFIIKNNIFDRSRHMMIHCGAGKQEWLPKFEGNTWIQHYESTGTLGRYGKNPTKNIPFDLGVRMSMKELKLEQNPDLYFAQNDWLCELPER